jgi:hypothetical protein
MADNIDVTPGTGKTVKTTDVGGEQIQHVIVDTTTGDSMDMGNGAAGSGTQRVAIASNSGMPLPTGAATAALQSNLQGTFGAVTAERAVIYDTSGNAVDWAAAVGVTQSGTWNITNVSGTVSLPTGAATAAKQPALGTAGSASADVITVQGIASGTALSVAGSIAPATAIGTVPGSVVLFRADSGTGSIYTDDTLNLPTMDLFGNVRTTLTNGAGALSSWGGNNSDAAGVFSSAIALSTNSSMRVFNGTSWDRLRTIQGAASTGLGTIAIERAPSTNAAAAIAPVATTVAASNVVLKGSGANVHSINAVTGASAGVVFLFNAISIPSDGTVTPVKAWIVAANSSLSEAFNPPLRLGTGATLAFGTGTSPFTLTASTTAFLSGEAV